MFPGFTCAFALSVVVAFVSCAVMEPDGPQVCARQLMEYIARALETPSVVDEIPIETLSIMRALQKGESKPCRALLDYIIHDGELSQLPIDRNVGLSWSVFINGSFAKFSQPKGQGEKQQNLDREEAKKIIREVVVPNHPILSQTSDYNLEDEINESFRWDTANLASLCSQIGARVLKKKMTQILATPGHPLYNSQEAYASFLGSYKATMSHDKSTGSGYPCEFLLKAPFEHVKALVSNMVSQNVFEGRVYAFARIVHASMEAGSPSEAERVLRSVWTDVYDRVAGYRSYGLVMSAYQQVQEQLKNGAAPREERIIGRDEFRQMISEALQSEYTKMSLSPFKIALFGAFNRDAEASRGFFEFVFENDMENRSIVVKEYNGPRFGLTYHGEFWPSLIDRRFHQFAREHKEEAQGIIESFLMLDHPFCTEIRALFDIGAFLKEPAPMIERHVHGLVERFFVQKWSEILRLGSGDGSKARGELVGLLERYEVLTWKGSEAHFGCLFLMKAPLEYIKRQASITPLPERGWLGMSLEGLASQVYELMRAEKADEAQRVLEDISPHVYHRTAQKEYRAVVWTFTHTKIKRLASAELGELLTATLETPRALKRVNPLYVPVLRALEQKAPVCQEFAEYICENYEPYRYLDGDGEHTSWSLLIEEYLRTFGKVQGRRHKALAQKMIEELVVPAHAYSSELRVHLDIGAFLGGGAEAGLAELVEGIVKRSSSERWNGIMKNKDAGAARDELGELVERYKWAFSWKDARLEYGSAFIMNVPLEYVRRQDTVTPLFGDGGLGGNLGEFAAGLYKLMEEESTDEARQALRKVQPQVYDRLEDKSYCAVMGAYAASGV